MEPTRSSSRSRRTAALAAVAAVAALAIPATAGATVTPAVVGGTLTLTGDATDDNLVLTDAVPPDPPGADPQLKHDLPVGQNGIQSAFDFNPDPNTVTMLPADASIKVVVNAVGGNDTVILSAATLDGAVIEGGEGDDVIVGSAAVDTIHGGPGNDRLTGFRGNETIEGQDGNDVMIWNNGDGKDVDEGGDGVDEALITTGAAADQMKVSPLAGGRTFFERSNAPFTVDMGTVEKLSLTSFSGDDTLETLPGVTLPMTIDAGPGSDTITTGAGTDRLIGDRGDDTLNAGVGDDTLVWNNGDGTDQMNGGDGLDRIEDNLGAANDVSKVKVVGGKVRYDRVNAPFGLNIASSEVLELNTFGGNDTLDVEPGVGALIAITADGGAANGARGGAGTDSAQADLADALAEVENADLPPVAVADTKGTAARVLNRRITSRLKRGVYVASIR